MLPAESTAAVHLNEMQPRTFTRKCGAGGANDKIVISELWNPGEHQYEYRHLFHADEQAVQLQVVQHR